MPFVLILKVRQYRVVGTGELTLLLVQKFRAAPLAGIHLDKIGDGESKNPGGLLEYNVICFLISVEVLSCVYLRSWRTRLFPETPTA